MNKLMIISIIAAFSVLTGESASQEQDTIDSFIGGTGPVSYESGPTLLSIRNSAFADNRVIKDVRADFVTTVGSGAFRGCISLETVRLDSVTDVSRFAGIFSGCGKLTNVFLQSIEFTDTIRSTGFPWGASNPGIVFHFKNGDFDRLGRMIGK